MRTGISGSSRVLITGGSGFVGSFVVKRFLRAGFTPAVLTRSRGNLWRLKAERSDIHVMEGRLEDSSSIEDQVVAFAPDLVCHFAWRGVEGEARNHSSQRRNVHETLALVDLVARAGCTTFLGMGSQAEYGPKREAISEDDEEKPTTLYGMSKLAARNLVQERCGQLGIRSIWLRLFSSYGPQDNPHWLIPYVTLAFLAGRSPELTAGTQRWDYIFVTDVSEVVLQVCASDGEGTFNVGSGVTHSVRQVVEIIHSMMEAPPPLKFGEKALRDDQVMHLQADTRKLEKVTGWKPTVSMEEGLRMTVDWFSKNRWRYE